VGQEDEATTTVVVINGDEVVVARLDGRVDLELVDRLARLTLHDPPPDLRRLLELCGLDDVLP
jgi:hypothetical protein